MTLGSRLKCAAPHRDIPAVPEVDHSQPVQTGAQMRGEGLEICDSISLSQILEVQAE